MAEALEVLHKITRINKLHLGNQSLTVIAGAPRRDM